MASSYLSFLGTQVVVKNLGTTAIILAKCFCEKRLPSPYLNISLIAGKVTEFITPDLRPLAMFR